MSVLQVTALSKHFGSQEVLSDVSFRLDRGDKVGLVGKNGSGKSTLLEIIVGRETPSAGSVAISRAVSIGYVPQYPSMDDDVTLVGYLLEDHASAERELRALEDELARVGGEQIGPLLDRYTIVREHYDRIDGDTAVQKAEETLESLGLGGAKDQRAATLSGGEKNIAALGRALMKRPDLLLLDEPGNHLDYHGLDRLETTLREYRGSLLIVSHNRYLLDRVTNGMYELERGRVRCYGGNYSAYRLAKLRDLVAQQADYVANRRRLDRLEELVKRFEQLARSTADPAWGKRLKARRSQLAIESSRAAPRPELDVSSIRLGIRAEQTRGDVALQVRGYSRSYGERVLFDSADLRFPCGRRVALVGPNGCGKTTFLNDLVTGGSWDSDTIRVGPSLSIAYCAQNQEVFDPSRTVAEELLTLKPMGRHDLYGVLARYLFAWDDMDKPISSLSGGELNRLQLARAEITGANFLVLDEPTNHLDIAAREAIEEGLEEFNGTILVVSHDRYFLDRVADAVVEITNGKFAMTDGSFSEYWAGKRAERDTRRPAHSRKAPGAATKAHAGKRSNGGARAAAAGVDQLVRRIEELEKDRAVLENDLTAAFGRGDHKKGRELSGRLAKTAAMLDRLYEEWDSEER